MTPMADFYFGRTDTGQVRSNNEDTFIVQPLADSRCIAACVIDGVGGYEGGEVAAQIAKETIEAQLQTDTNDWPYALKKALAVANERIYAEKMNRRNNQHMACVATLALADLANNQFYYAHVGDTRLYLFRDHSLVKVTHDHSFVGFLEDNKRLSEAEAMRHPKRNEINKALGFDAHIDTVKDYIETGVSPFLPGDILLLCSDGLSDMVNSQTMTAILMADRSIPQKTEALIAAANNAGGKDNITVVLVQNTNEPVVHQATRPTTVKKNKQAEEKKEPVRTAPIVEPTVKERTNLLVPVLAVLCAALAGTVIWLWSRSNDRAITTPPLVQTPVRNAVEQKVKDSLNSTPILVLSDSAYAKNIVISDTLFIQRDSLHIKGNGVIWQSDSAYHGPALVVAATCRHIVLEDMVFQDFDKGLLAEGKVLQLKNVRFINCRIPLQYHYLFPSNIPVSGTITDTPFFKTDSLSKASNP